MVGEALGVQLGDDSLVRVDVPWRLGPPDPAASSLTLPAFPYPTHVSGPWQSPMRSVMRTTSELWSGRRPRPERWLRSGVPAMPQVRAKGAGAGRGTCPFLAGCVGGTEMPPEARPRAVSTGHAAQTLPSQPRAHRARRGADGDPGPPCPKSPEPVPA